MSIGLIRHGSQVAAGTIFPRCVRPYELCVWLKKDPLAVTRRTSFGPSRWHVEDCRTAFDERWSEGYVLVPRNRPVISSHVFGALFAINNRVCAVNRDSSHKPHVRLVKHAAAVQSGKAPGGNFLHLPSCARRLPMGCEPSRRFLLCWCTTVVKAQAVAG